MSFPLWSHLLWILNAALETAILWYAIRRRSLPWPLTALIAVTLLTDGLCALLLATHSGRAYAYCYWISQDAEIILRAYLAFRILAHVLRPHLREIVVAGLYSAGWIAYALWQHFQPDPLSMLRISAAANLCALALITAALVIPSAVPDWPRGWSAIAFGLWLAAALDLALALLQRRSEMAHAHLFIAAWQLAPLPSLYLWLEAARAGNNAPESRSMAA